MTDDLPIYFFSQIVLRSSATNIVKLYANDVKIEAVIY